MGINRSKKSWRATVKACTSTFLVIPTEHPSWRNGTPRLDGRISISRTWLSLDEKMRTSSWNASFGLDIGGLGCLANMERYNRQSLIIFCLIVIFLYFIVLPCYRQRDRQDGVVRDTVKAERPSPLLFPPFHNVIHTFNHIYLVRTFPISSSRATRHSLSRPTVPLSLSSRLP